MTSVESAVRSVTAPHRVARALTGAGVLATALLLASCGSGGSGAGGSGSGSTAGPSGANSSALPTPSKDATLAGQIPQDVAADGKIVIGSDASYPPNEFYAEDNTTIIGMDVDLGTAIGQKLGLRVEFVNNDFASILPGLESGKFELAMSSFTDNTDREKVVDMVSYFSAGTKLATPKGNAANVTIDTLCGKTVAVQKGTVQVDDVTARSDKCKQAGRPEITVSEFQAQTDATLALTSGRAQAMLADSPVVDYAVKQTSGAVQAVGDAYDTAPYGIAVPKGKGQYAAAIQGAVQALIADGTYQAILDKWGVAQGGVTKSAINAAGAGG